MSTFKERLKQILADTYYKDNESFEFKSQNQEIPKSSDLSKYFSYHKFQKSINELSKVKFHSTRNKESPTKILNELKPKILPKHKNYIPIKNTNNKSNKVLPNHPGLCRSFSSINLDLKTNSKIKSKIEMTKGIINYNNDNSGTLRRNYSLGNLNNYYKGRPLSSNIPLRNLDTNLLKVKKSEIIEGVPINYKTSYNTLTISNSSRYSNNNNFYDFNSNLRTLDNQRRGGINRSRFNINNSFFK